MVPVHRWWQSGVIYQIFVPSFLDTQGHDGIGDLPGVIEGLDYLQWLGVKGIWLSPIHPSPMAESGYDITDFEEVHPQFGTLEVFDELIRTAHVHDIRVIMDWVPNHTSSQHPWFVESQSSRDHPRRNWYIWRDAKADGGPPNNWISVFGGSVWKWHPRSGQYYLHTFLDQQPDLNWRCPSVQRAMLGNMRYWLERGVDGLRVDALHVLLKDERFRDNPPNSNYREGEGPDSRQIPEHTHDQPGIHPLVAEMREIVSEFGPDRLLVGEMYVPYEKLVTYYGAEKPELHFPLHLGMSMLPWTAKDIGAAIDSYLRHLPPEAWPTWTFSTHDSPRLATRCPAVQTRLAAMLLMTLPGTPTLYYGEEIGMQGVPIPPAEALDPQGRLTGRNRDPERTPMQWTASSNAGFTRGAPWLPIGADVATANVAVQREDSQSLLTLYRELIALRKAEPGLVFGKVESIRWETGVVTYLRENGSRPFCIVLNFNSDPVPWRLPFNSAKLLVTTYLDGKQDKMDGRLFLRSGEGMILAIE